jgi:phosphate-selective porin OprO/OprP
MSQTHKLLLPAVLAASAVLATPAYAANDAMMQLLKVLKDKGTIDEATYEGLVNAAKADDEHVQFAEDEVKKAAKEQPTIETKGKLEVTSADKDFKFRIGGRLHVDATFADNDRGTTRKTNFEDRATARRMRLYVEAQLWKKWAFKTEYDFADATTGGSPQTGLRDIWMRYLIGQKGDNITGNVTLGQFVEYIALEEINSSNEMTFAERSVAAQAFDAANGRRLGLGTQLALYDKFNVSLGVFGRELGVTTPDDSKRVTGRLVYSPVHYPGRVLHLGFAGSYISDFDSNTFSANPRSEFDNPGGNRLLNTSITNVDDGYRLAAEAAAVYGRFSLQGEYQDYKINRRGSLSDLDFNAWYVQGTVSLTGEPRNYSFDEARFKAPKPAGIVGKGGWGAWELALRYSSIDLLDKGLGGGEEDTLTAGLNWYATPNLRFLANYVRVLDLTGGNFNGAEPSAFILGSRLYF